MFPRRSLESKGALGTYGRDKTVDVGSDFRMDNVRGAIA